MLWKDSEDVQSYARHLLWENFSPFEVPKFQLELKLPVPFCGAFFGMDSKKYFTFRSKTTESRPWLKETLHGNTSQPWLCSYSGWNKGKLHKSKRVNKGFPLMCVFAVRDRVTHTIQHLPYQQISCAVLTQTLNVNCRGPKDCLCVSHKHFHRSESTEQSLNSLNIELLQL